MFDGINPSGNRNRNNNKNDNNNNIFQTIFGILIALSFSFFIWWSLFSNGASTRSYSEISYTEFLSKVEAGEIYKVDIGDDIVAYEKREQDNEVETTQAVTTQNDYQRLYDFFSQYDASLVRENVYRIIKVEADTELVKRLLEKGDIIISGKRASVLRELLFGLVIPFLFIFFLMSFMARRMGGLGGGIMGVGRSNAKRYMQKVTGVTFNDVAGEDEAKESLVEIVDFLHNPTKYTVLGAKLPKGALLVGPPGTGKTLLAKAVAGEAKVPFFSMSGSDFVEMFVGVGASRVRDLFKQAKAVAPCIVFIDEIDALGKARDIRGGADSEREQTLNQLLSEMDGFEINQGIMVMAATNRPEILDPALLRPGRFDRRIIVERPDLKGRVNILKVHAKDVKLGDDVDFEEIALLTSGAVGADLANMINEAAISAAKAKREKVTQDDLKDAVEVVFVGKEKKDRILSQEERKIVSYHEVGHALASALQKHTEPVQKITIVPRTSGALGYVLQSPEEEKYLNTKKELEEQLVTALAGRAAEEIVFDTITTGAANDIEQATKLARSMVTQYGMSKRFGVMGLATKQSAYLSNNLSMECGDDTATLVDEEVKDMLNQAYEKSKNLLSQYREALDKIAEHLIEKETISGKEFMRIFTEITGIEEEKKERIVKKED